MTKEAKSGINSPSFRAWLDDVSCVCQSQQPPAWGCDRCGAAVDSQPFFGDCCLFCCAYQFGRYEKSQELAIFAKLIIRTIQNSSLIDLTQEIEDINWDCILPLANSEEAKRVGDLQVRREGCVADDAD